MLKLYLLTGVILPIWTSIPGETSSIYRDNCDDGTSYLGRALDAQDAGVLGGLYMSVDVADPVSIFMADTEGQKVVALCNGLTLTERRIAGHKRLEMTGEDRTTLDWLREWDCFTDIHQDSLRVFIPHEDRAAILAVICA